MKDDRVYLQDILDEINFLISLKPALTYEDLLHDTIKEHAVIRSLQIIGEATKKVSMSARKAHPEIPWTDMAKFRDKVSRQNNARVFRY